MSAFAHNVDSECMHSPFEGACLKVRICNKGLLMDSSGGAGGTEQSADDTWESYATGFMEQFCISCHNDDNAGEATRDYHQLSVVMAESAEIACGLSKSEEDWNARGCTGFSPGAPISGWRWRQAVRCGSGSAHRLD